MATSSQSDFLFPSKVAAALCGLCAQTFKQSRCTTRRSARADLLVPAATRCGKRGQRYALAELLLWSRLTGKPLLWDACPLSVVLPAVDALVDAGIDLPASLENVVRSRRL